MQRFNVILFSFILFSPILSSAYAQTTTPTDLSNCTIIRVNSIYTPFRIVLAHDPTLEKTHTIKQDDPASALSFEGADPNSPGALDPKTHLAFSSNSTDNWQITLQLDFSNEKDPHVTIADFYQNKEQQLFMTQTILSHGPHLCASFFLNAHPAPHIPTSDEILVIAQKIEEQAFITHDKAILDASNSAKQTSDRVVLLGIAMFIVMVITIMVSLSGGWYTKRLNDEMVFAKNHLIKAISFVKATGQYDALKNKEAREENKIMITEFINNSALKFNQTINRRFDEFSDMLVQWLSKEKLEPVKKETPMEKTIIPEEIPPSKPSVFDKIKEGGKAVLEIVIPNPNKPEPPTPELKKWYEEFKQEKYKGKLEDLWYKWYTIASEDPKSVERIKIDAISMIIKELGNWP